MHKHILFRRVAWIFFLLAIIFAGGILVFAKAPIAPLRFTSALGLGAIAVGLWFFGRHDVTKPHHPANIPEGQFEGILFCILGVIAFIWGLIFLFI